MQEGARSRFCREDAAPSSCTTRRACPTWPIAPSDHGWSFRVGPPPGALIGFLGPRSLLYGILPHPGPHRREWRMGIIDGVVLWTGYHVGRALTVLIDAPEPPTADARARTRCPRARCTRRPTAGRAATATRCCCEPIAATTLLAGPLGGQPTVVLGQQSARGRRYAKPDAMASPSVLAAAGHTRPDRVARRSRLAPARSRTRRATLDTRPQ